MASTFRRVWINLINLSGEYGSAPILKRFFFFLFPFAPENLVYLARRVRPSSRVSPLVLHTWAESGFHLRDSSCFPRRYPFIYIFNRPRVKSRVYRVTQLRIDGIHCRESAGTGPVNHKVVPNEYGLGRSPWTIFFVLLSFSHTHYYWYVVDTCDTESFRGCCPQENFDVKKENLDGTK